MPETFTTAQRAAFLKVVTSLRDDFRKRISQWNYRSIVEDHRNALEKGVKLPQLRAALEKAEAAVEPFRQKVRDAEALVKNEIGERQREYEADTERNFVRAMAEIVAASTAAEAQASIERIL
jgi:hypothetical protein